MASDLSEMGTAVRDGDHDRYVTALMAPAPEREALFALYAFNLELAKVREGVSEELIGRMRFQWWRDRLPEIAAGRAPRQPVAEALADAMRAFPLPEAALLRLIDARDGDLEAPDLADLDALERHAEALVAPVAETALAILNAPVSDDIAQPFARAVALTGWIRAVPFHAAQRRCYLPKDLCEAAGLDLTKLYDRGPQAELTRVVEPIAARARAALSDLRARARRMPKRALPALMPATLAGSHLSLIAKADFDPFDARLHRKSAGALLDLAWHKMIGRL